MVAEMKGLFRSIRFQVILFTIFIVIVGNIILGYSLTQEATKKLLDVKREKLNGYAQNLSQTYMTIVRPIIESQAREQYDSQKPYKTRSYEEILKETRSTRIELPLRDFTHIINSSYDELGAGFYFTDLKRAVAYSGNSKYSEDKKLTAYVPLGTDGSFLWIEESYRNINLKIKEIQRKALTPLIIVIVFTLFLGILFAYNFTSKIKKIKFSLSKLREDLSYKVPNLSGELGEISQNINILAESLLKSRSKSDLILESAKTGMISITHDFKLSFINTNAKNILGIDSSNDNCDEILNLLGPLVKKGVEQSFTNLTIFSFDSVHGEFNNGEKYLNIIVSPYSDPVGEKTVLITLDDITENVRLIKESERNESLKMLGLFTAGIAHEIRNPLTSIKGFIQILSKRIQDSSDNSRLINLVLKEIERLESLIKDLIIYAKPTRPSPDWVSISEIVNTVNQILSQRIYQKKIEIKLENLGSIEIFVDKKHIYQILFNLILNSIQAVKPNDGIIRIHYIINELDNIILIIEDNGVGIGKDEHTKIFTPFYTTKDKGTGLGLAITKRMVEDNGGKLSFESEYDKGTIFSLELPKYRIKKAINTNE
jgi:two-component system, NtrC family, sensor histidine kinase AtoS